MTLTPRTALLVLFGLWLATLAGAPLVGSHAISLGDVAAGDPMASAIFWRSSSVRALTSASSSLRCAM